MGLLGHLILPATSVQQVSVIHPCPAVWVSLWESPAAVAKLSPKVWAVLCLPFAKESLRFRSQQLVTFLIFVGNRHMLELMVCKW